MILNGTVSAKDEERGRGCDRRRERFVDLAREAFFRNGYAATTMSEIAAAAGGSKTTLWSYFPSKEDLFAAVCDDLAERYGCAMTVELDPAAPVEEQLRRFAHALLTTVLSPPVVELQRMVIGEASRFPELARLFYERGPARGKARLADFCAQAMERGQLRAGDPKIASRQFVGLLQAGTWQWRLLGLIDDLSPANRAEEIDTAVGAFLRCWAATD
jgi:TetR/AcrR family transcriptional regulator, mexJK operon transcriptional repressor